MFTWIFDECRKGKCPVGTNTPLLCSAASLIPRCLQRVFDSRKVIGFMVLGRYAQGLKGTGPFRKEAVSSGNIL